MRPEQFCKPNSSEHVHQVCVFMWAALNQAKYPMLEKLLFAIPNGGSRGETARTAAIVGGKLKAEGVKAGVSDLTLAWPAKGFHGFFIEMKKPGGKAQQNQLDFGNAVIHAGYKFAVCDHWEKARDLIVEYLS